MIALITAIVGLATVIVHGVLYKQASTDRAETRNALSLAANRAASAREHAILAHDISIENGSKLATHTEQLAAIIPHLPRKRKSHKAEAEEG